MRFAVSVICCVLLSTPTAQCETFKKGIKYLGGAGFPDKKGIRDSWDNGMNVTEKEITFSFRKNLLPTETVATSAISKITYGQATTRRVGKWVAVGVILAPVALAGIFHKSRQHRILLEWTDSQQRERGILMQAHKDIFVTLLNDLAFRSGQPIFADADDREWLFRNGVKAELDSAPVTDKK